MKRDYKDYYGILWECPKGRRDMNCPLIEVESLTFKEKIEWFEKLSPIIQNKIIKHHMECSRTRIL